MRDLIFEFKSLVLFGLLLNVACNPTTPPNQQAYDQALLQAIAEGDATAADSVLRLGADANFRDEEGTPVIIRAAIAGRRDLLEKLIQNGADINAKRLAYYQSTALMEISVKNDTAMASYLLDQGADLTIRDTFGDTAINWACYYGHIPFVERLLENGARFDMDSRHGTALDIAMKQGHDQLVDFLIGKGAGESLPVEQQELVSAVKGNRLSEVRALIKTGADVNQLDPVGTPILVLAASNGNKDLVRLLLEKKVDPDLMNRVGQTALSRAALFSHELIVAMLLKNGADPNLANEKYRLTPLISASIAGNASIGNLLLENGASIDVQDGIQGYTPLMYATAYNHPEMVKVLLKAGANPYLKGFDGAELYDMVSFSNNAEINTIIQEHLMDQQ